MYGLHDRRQAVFQLDGVVIRLEIDGVCAVIRPGGDGVLVLEHEVPDLPLPVFADAVGKNAADDVIGVRRGLP